MKISTPLVKALNNQISMEANAANAYLSAASWCEVTGYDGAANFFHSQAEEEHQHMLKFINFVNGQCLGAIIPGTKQPPKTFKSFVRSIKGVTLTIFTLPSFSSLWGTLDHTSCSNFSIKELSDIWLHNWGSI